MSKKMNAVQRIAPEVPPLVFDEAANECYSKGRALGKGFFSECYELTNRSTGETVAGKVVSKKMLKQTSARDQMAEEIKIHRETSHPNVVKLITFFQDPDNLYLTMELCNRNTLLELIRRRKGVTEPEARFFTHQVVKGVAYLHDLRIAHRDLKPGNFFLNDNLQIKIGDFGFATKVIGDKKPKGFCGTPNYVAPEVLDKRGHSLEVDIWAIGCVLYSLLFCEAPFETKSAETTFDRIRNNDYTIPPTASDTAASLIRKILKTEPQERPTAGEVLFDVFFTAGFMPTSLPISCLVRPPVFGNEPTPSRNRQQGGRVLRSATAHSNIQQQQQTTGRVALSTVPTHSLTNNSKTGKRCVYQ